MPRRVTIQVCVQSIPPKKTKDVYIQNTGNGCGPRARNAVLDRERHANAGAEKLNSILNGVNWRGEWDTLMKGQGGTNNTGVMLADMAIT